MSIFLCGDDLERACIGQQIFFLSLSRFFAVILLHGILRFYRQCIEVIATMKLNHTALFLFFYSNKPTSALNDKGMGMSWKTSLPLPKQ